MLLCPVLAEATVFISAVDHIILVFGPAAFEAYCTSTILFSVCSTLQKINNILSAAVQLLFHLNWAVIIEGDWFFFICSHQVFVYLAYIVAAWSAAAPRWYLTPT